MLTLAECRRTDPRLAHLPDDELRKIRDEVYRFAKISLDDYLKKMSGSTISPVVIYSDDQD